MQEVFSLCSFKTQGYKNKCRASLAGIILIDRVIPQARSVVGAGDDEGSLAVGKTVCAGVGDDLEVVDVENTAARVSVPAPGMPAARTRAFRP